MFSVKTICHEVKKEDEEFFKRNKVFKLSNPSAHSTQYNGKMRTELEIANEKLKKGYPVYYKGNIYVKKHQNPNSIHQYIKLTRDIEKMNEFDYPFDDKMKQALIEAQVPEELWGVAYMYVSAYVDGILKEKRKVLEYFKTETNAEAAIACLRT